MSNQPTPSEPTNQLIAAATKIAEGEASPESYYPTLSQRLQQSAQNREMMEAKGQARGEGFLEAHGELLDNCLDLMENYESGLLKHAEFFETGEPQALLAGNDILIETVVPLRAALDAFGTAYLTYGPSEYPVMNSVLNLLRGLAEGSATPYAFNEVKKKSISFYQVAIEEIDASEHGTSEGYQAKKKAFQDLIRALEELEPVSNIDAIEKAVHPLQLALEAKTSADEKIFLENTSIKPTNMPSANVLINTIRGCLDEFYERENAQEALTWYRAFSEQLEEQFDLAVEGETNSLVILEELPKAREIMDLHDELLDQFEEAFEDFERDEIETIINDFIDVVDRLEASSEVFMEAAEREGKLVCVKCGHANPPSNRTCESCGFKLPQLVDPNMFSQTTFELEERSGLDAAEEDDYHMGVNTFRLFEAAYHFYERQIDEDAFLMEIESSRDIVARSEAGIADLTAREITEKQREMMSPEQLQTFEESIEMFQETKELLEEGIDEWLDGLEYFEQYIESRHRPTLETGIQMIFIASQKIHKVHKLGEIANQTLNDMNAREREEARNPGPAETPVAEPTEEEESEHVISYEETYDDGSDLA